MKKILLIEDELLLQKSLKKLLEKRGAYVESTRLGFEAINLLMNNDYDRIICDLMLQDISGFDVIEEAKKKYQLDEIGQIFIIITAYSSKQVLDKAHTYNCRVLSKPFNNINSTLEMFLNCGKNYEKY